MLSNYYEDACEVLEAALSENSFISISSFNSPIVSQVVLEAKTFEHFGSEDSDRANMKLYLQYKELRNNPESGKFQYELSAMELLILNSEGDTRWTPRMKANVWANKYPATVAIDINTGEVYLLFLQSWGIELRHFAKMPLGDLTGFMMTLNPVEPFYIYIYADAMFSVLDGAEGYNHLLDNLYIQFNGAKNYRVSLRGKV